MYEPHESEHVLSTLGENLLAGGTGIGQAVSVEQGENQADLGDELRRESMEITSRLRMLK
ncbi:MAG: hypothetical protein QXI32_02680 [Candidatus Bathyarchaeia archaeon]